MTKQPFGKKGWTPECIDSLAGKTVLITGTTAGAGFEAARILLSKGAKVIGLNRSAKKSAAGIEQLKQEFGEQAPISAVQMDLSDLSSVKAAAAEVLDTVPQIDALICNAAIAQVAMQEMTVDGFESQLGVNHMGHFVLCGMLFDRIEASQGRIVVVGSNGYKMGLKRIQFEDLNFDQNYSGWNAYSQSKLAQMMFGYELQRRIAKAGKSVEVRVCHPGAAKTSLINDKASFGLRLAWKLMSVFAQTAEKGAWPELMCATEEGLDPVQLYGPTRMEMSGPVGICKLDPLALDEEAAAKLWAVSEEKTGFSWSL